MGRSRLAETIISKMVVFCPNIGCGEQLYNEELRRHEREQCLFRTTRCKFFLIGCDWRGIAKKKHKHEKSCEIRSFNANEILKRCQQRALQKETADKKRAQVFDSYQKVSFALSQRNKNVVVRDLKIFSFSSTFNSSSSGLTKATYQSRCFSVFGCVFFLQIQIKEVDKKFSFGASANSVSNGSVNSNNSICSNSVSTRSVNDHNETKTATKSEDKTNKINNINNNNKTNHSLLTLQQATTPVVKQTNPCVTPSTPNSSLCSNLNTVSSKSNHKHRQEAKKQPNYIFAKLVCKKHQGKPRVEAIVLPGPHTNPRFRPVFLKVAETNNLYSSKESPLNISRQQGIDMFGGENMHLRIVLFDKSNGTDSTFTINENFCYADSDYS